MVKLGKTKVWGRSYTTIPFTVRKILDIKKGDSLEWVLKDGSIIIKKTSPDQEEKNR